MAIGSTKQSPIRNVRSKILIIPRQLAARKLIAECLRHSSFSFLFFSQFPNYITSVI